VSAERRVLAAEVEALLVEIAADPRSNLLRVERSAALPELFAKRPPVSSGAAFLTRCERHLVDGHRDEVATVLTRMAAFAALRLPTLDGALLVPVPLERATIGESALRLLASGERLDGEREVRAALARAADRSRTETWEPFALLAAALRLGEPRGARQWWPLLLTGAGHHTAALNQALELEGLCEDGFGRSLAASNGGLAAWRLGAHAQAAECYRRAYSARREEPMYLAFHQINALLADLQGEAVTPEVGDFPIDEHSRGFLASSIRSSPVPGLAGLRERAAKRRHVPRVLQPAAEVLLELV